MLYRPWLCKVLSLETPFLILENMSERKSSVEPGSSFSNTVLEELMN